jgi:surfactin synthase thioesterase subunit
MFLGQISGDRPVIFCFHHAGGNARTFRNWIRSRMVDVISVELPGHGIRSAEPITSDLKTVCREIAASIAQELQKQEKPMEFSLFGHSLGAILAFDVTCYLRQNYGLRPCCLQVSGRHAPQDEDPSAYRTSMGIAPLVDVIRDLGHTPPELLESREFLDYIMPTVFKDYAMSESFVYDHQSVDVPIYAYSGSEDTDADQQIMQHWEDVTSEKFRMREFSGDHFYLFDQENHVADRVVEDMLHCCQSMKRPVSITQVWETGII